MPTIHILGKILSSAILLTFDGLPEIDHTASDIGLTMHFAININQSEVDITVDLNEWNVANFDWIYVRAFDFCRTCIDIFHFATGEGFLLHLDRLITPDGQVSPIASRNPNLSQFCTFVKFPAVTLDERMSFQKVLVKILSEPPLFMALHDLMQSSMVPHQGITNCARVIDGLRKLISPDLDAKLGWPLFHAVVNVDEAYLQMIFRYAKQTRHGDRSHINGIVTTEILYRTHQVMNRFIEYRLGDNQPLSVEAFPLLTG